MKRRPFSVILAIVLIVWLPVTMWIYRTLGHRALEKYVAELRGKGEKLTLRELSGPISVFEKLDSLAKLTNAVLALGEPPGGATNVKVMRFVGPGLASIAWKQETLPWLTSGDATDDAWASLSGHLKAMPGPLGQLREAAAHAPRNAGPRTYLFAPSPTPHRAVRAAVAWLICATVTSLREDGRSDVLADIQAISGLANLHRDENVLASQMVRVAVGAPGLDSTWEALQDSKWDRQQLAALQRCWNGVDFLEALEKGIEAERCQPLEMLRALREAGWHGEMVFTNKTPDSARSDPAGIAGQRLVRFALRSVAERDLLLMLRDLQSEVEMARSLRQDHAWKEIEGSLQELNGRMNKLAQSPTRIFHFFTMLTMINLKGAFRVAVRAETQRRIVITAIALKRFELDKGRPAATLSSLVPDYLPQVLRDCMSGEPLRYKANRDGTFTLYSVGEDGKDDGGDPTPAKAGSSPGFWEGRDAVWPAPAPDQSAAKASLRSSKEL